MEMKEENKIHLEGAKVYGPQDYEVVDEFKKLKEENRKLKKKVRFLEECLDRKEILNATYREEINKLKNGYM